MLDFERRLTTIMFTDIVSYSSMMSKNETLALQWVDFFQRKSTEVISQHHGSIIKTLGDGMLIVFNSVFEAIDSAKLLQQEIKDFNSGNHHSEMLLLRIGIHVGDVLVKSGDVFGHGVNVAARLQQISLPGGLCLSEAAWSVAGSEARSEFREVKNVFLKNLAENYTVYQLPSIYPDDYPIEKTSSVNESKNLDFVITALRKIPPEKLNVLDSFLLAFFVIVALDIIIAFIISLNEDLTLSEALSEMLSNKFMIAHNIFFVFFLSFFILRDAVEIKFQDVRGADSLISYVIQRFGFRPPVRNNGQLIFKPTLYNRIMWQTQKMRVNISGNKMAISGSYIFLRKVKKMLQPYITPPK
jgi:class 3 adenylate cyclase